MFKKRMVEWMKKSEPILSKIPNDCRASCGRTKTERSGGQKERRVTLFNGSSFLKSGEAPWQLLRKINFGGSEGNPTSLMLRGTSLTPQMWTVSGSNRPPSLCHSDALPNELTAQCYRLCPSEALAQEAILRARSPIL